MKKVVILIVFTLLFLINPVQAVESKPVVVFLPHQDDEMVLAGAIADYVAEGRQVYTVMVTNGASSYVREMLMEKGYTYITKVLFAYYRNNEYYYSMQHLGVKPENIYFANPKGRSGTKNPLFEDGKLTTAHVERVLNRTYEKWGDAVYIAVAGNESESDYPHPDHAIIEKTIQDYSRINEKYFYTDRRDIGEKVKLSPETLQKKYEALQEYFVWKPAERRFAIGANSVYERLRFWQTHGFEYRI